MHTLCELPFSSVVVHIEPLLQVPFELTLPPSFEHSPSVSADALAPPDLAGVETGLFLTTAKAGPVPTAEPAIIKAVKTITNFFMDEAHILLQFSNAGRMNDPITVGRETH
jgi:hypothetical protein